ncbi:MAG TPA: FAD-dependent oxidoreductase [Mycobacteriales bacterium]|nr:FAD-dependent oxidoreductase [Mycobacteriales bacterium]
MARQRLVVIGGDAGGMSAASQARRRRPSDDLEIVAVERGRHTSYSACGIPYWIGGVVSDLDALVVRTPEEFRQRYAIDALVGHEAVALDLDRQTVVVQASGGTRRVLDFDQVVIATGAVPRRPDLPGADAAGVFGVQTLHDGEAVRAALDAGARRAVVVGAGYIGLEMAEALLNRGLAVSVVEAGPQPLSRVDPDMGAKVAEAMRGMGIAVHTDEPVRAIDTGPDGSVRTVVTTRRELLADVVILGLGVRPDSDLARAAGVAVGPTGGIRTDASMRSTSHPGVWAAGDCVETTHRVSLAPVHVPLGTHANKQGRVAGINIGGGYATFPGVVGTAVTRVCDLEIARTGLTESEAERAGFRFVAAVVESTTRAGYYPGAAPITTKLVAEKSTGRLLGAQIVGREGAAKRIDVLAAAVWQAMTVEEITGLDLSYAPPFAPVWDPVLVAARRATDAVETGRAPR